MTVLQLGIFNGTIIQFCFTGRNITTDDTALPHFKTGEAAVLCIKIDEAALSCLKTIEVSVPHI
jgi:hypothetical protein